MTVVSVISGAIRHIFKLLNQLVLLDSMPSWSTCLNLLCPVIFTFRNSDFYSLQHFSLYRSLSLMALLCRCCLSQQPVQMFWVRSSEEQQNWFLPVETNKSLPKFYNWELWNKISWKKLWKGIPEVISSLKEERDAEIFMSVFSGDHRVIVELRQSRYSSCLNMETDFSRRICCWINQVLAMINLGQ